LPILCGGSACVAPAALASNSAIGQAAQLARNMILARLLVSEDFGLMAVVRAVIQPTEAFTELGLGWSIVQNPRSECPNLEPSEAIAPYAAAFLGPPEPHILRIGRILRHSA
jgi:hypothetical protein